MVRESNHETVFAGTGEPSALDRETGEPLAQTDDERSEAAVAIANAGDAKVEVRADSLAAVSGTFVRNHSLPPSASSHWRVALVVGTGLGAALSALSYSQRSVNLAREASVSSAGRPAAHEQSALAATLARPAAESPPGEVALSSQPSAIETAQTEATQSSLATPPTAAEASSGEATVPDVVPQPSAAAVAPAETALPAPQPSAAEVPGQTGSPTLAIQNAARSPGPNQPSAQATPPTPKPEKVSALAAPANPTERAVTAENATAPAPDSEEARLAAAAVRTGSDGPMDGVIDDAFTNAQARAEQRRAALAAAAAVPLVPARDDVIDAMRELLPALRECAQGQTGLASAEVVVSNDGNVQMVGLTGHAFGGTPSGRCMEGVVMRARFPVFRQASFRMQFPFLLQ